VNDLKPKKSNPAACCLIDTNLTVDFAPPEEKSPPQVRRQISTGTTTLSLDTPAEGAVETDGYAYFQFRIVDPLAALKFTLTAKNGDPDLYVSSVAKKPSNIDYIWSAATVDGDEFVIDPSHPQFSTSMYYIAVHGYGAESEFELMVEEATPLSELDDADMKAANTIDRQFSQHDSSEKKCDNCHAFIPERGYTMHTLRCARVNWRCDRCSRVVQRKNKDKHSHCPLCNLVVPEAEVKKHIDVVHAKFQCDCGAEFERDTLAIHKQEECPLRMLKCKYCQVSIPATEHKAHETYCGSKTTACEICGKAVPRNRMEIHNATDHNINPSARGPYAVPSSLPSSGTGSSSSSRSALATIGGSIVGAEDAALQAALAASLSSSSITAPSAPPLAIPRRTAPGTGAAVAAAAAVGPGPAADIDAAMLRALAESNSTADAHTDYQTQMQQAIAASHDALMDSDATLQAAIAASMELPVPDVQLSDPDFIDEQDLDDDGWDDDEDDDAFDCDMDAT
jgi:hypothetical protein